MPRQKPKRSRTKIVQKDYRLPASRSTIDLLNLMPITGYMRFSLESADNPKLFDETVEVTGDFATPSSRAIILGNPHRYKFTITFINKDGSLLDESDYYVNQPVSYDELEQIIIQLANEQGFELDTTNLDPHKSTITLSVYNPNTKEHI